MNDFIFTKLVCIDPVTDILNLSKREPELTYGREYNVIRFFEKLEDGRQFIGIRNDSNNINDYLLSRFVTPKQWIAIKRNNKLNDIL